MWIDTWHVNPEQKDNITIIVSYLKFKLCYNNDQELQKESTITVLFLFLLYNYYHS